MKDDMKQALINHLEGLEDLECDDDDIVVSVALYDDVDFDKPQPDMTWTLCGNELLVLIYKFPMVNFIVTSSDV